jgi:hypothetical protein
MAYEILFAILFVVAILCIFLPSTVEHFSADRPSDVARARRLRHRIERRQEREEEDRWGGVYRGPWGSPYGGPYAPGPYGPQVAPGFYQPEEEYSLQKGKAPDFFDTEDSYDSKDITQVLSQCSSRFNPRCNTIVHDLKTDKVYKYVRPTGRLQSRSGINTYIRA